MCSKLTHFSPFEQTISSIQKGVSNHDNSPIVTYRWQSGLMTFMTALLLLVGSMSWGQNVNATWGANGNSAWYTGGNWSGGIYPGLQGAAASNTNIATFTSAFTGTTIGINMGGGK
jgi:hypothetical protein